MANTPRDITSIRCAPWRVEFSFEQRGWGEAAVYVDRGVSGAKDCRPALDDLLKAARRRQDMYRPQRR